VQELRRQGPAEKGRQSAEVPALSWHGVAVIRSLDANPDGLWTSFAPDCVQTTHSSNNLLISETSKPISEFAMPHERIEINPDVMGGKPVVRGTRVPVEHILRKLGAGLSAADIVADHPRLTPDDIQAAQAFAADYLADEEITFG